MKESYDAMEAVKVLFNQVKGAVKFSDNAAQPYTDPQGLRVALNLIFEICQFTQSCEKWEETITQEKIG